jgi:hypothetical protein
VIEAAPEQRSPSPYQAENTGAKKSRVERRREIRIVTVVMSAGPHDYQRRNLAFVMALSSAGDLPRAGLWGCGGLLARLCDFADCSVQLRNTPK